jgi:hypothetical protein
MPMTLRLSEAEAAALRARAKREARSMQDVARQAVREYVENHSKADPLDQVLDEELPRYAEALERLISDLPDCSRTDLYRQQSP